MGRRIEFAAGIATITLALLAALLLLFAPLLPYCPTAPHVCAASELRYRSLAQGRLGAGEWALILLPALVALIGGAGALFDTRIDARTGGRAGILALGVALFIGLIFCVLGATGLGVVYLPTFLALGLAGYGAFLRRRTVGRSHDHSV